MEINVKTLSFDYDYNQLVERAIGNLLSAHSGLLAHDFGGTNVPRPEYDFILGNLPVELKITAGVPIPVELSKDLDQKIPSGILASKAPYILYLSHGHDTNSLPTGKLRLFRRTWLLNQARKIHPTFYQGLTDSQSALVCYIKGPFHTDDIWLGDVKLLDNGNYDVSQFTPSNRISGVLNCLNQSYIDGDL